jgi:galactose mutarotase-like enzyme
MTKVKIDSRDGFTFITLDNGVIRLVLLPELGGKISSLLRLTSGREYLISCQGERRGFRKPFYGAAFVNYNNVGFDECLPTIAECQYPEGEFAGAQLPDHGDVWALPWQYDIQGEELSLCVAGRSLPYLVRKRLRLEENELVMEYQLQNRSSSAFYYLWSSHPLLNVEPGARIVLPPESDVLLIDSSQGERLGCKGESCTWPVARLSNVESDDLSVMKSHGNQSDKLYTSRLKNGYCGIHYPRTDESIFFRFDVRTVPYVGLWICHGGIGAYDPTQPYTVALEPCSGRPDSLAEAIARRECSHLLPHATDEWSLRIACSAGLPPKALRN